MTTTMITLEDARHEVGKTLELALWQLSELIARPDSAPQHDKLVSLWDQLNDVADEMCDIFGEDEED